MDEKLVGERIKEAAETLGGLNALSLVTEIPRRTLGAWVSGETEPRLSGIVAISRHTGRSVNWLSGFDDSGKVGGRIDLPRPLPTKDGPDFTLIPRYSVSASAGNGLAVLEEREADRLAFRADWLREMGLTPSHCGLVTAAGDSMQPTIPNGALLLVDLTPGQQMRSGCLYVVVLEGDLLVKRLMRRIDGSIELVSDNPIYPKEIVDNNGLDRLTIPGRVVWIGHSV